ncbi:MAG TPA: tRNA (adenosine(37)-N6)-threonylcarbamoyltransferase complex dimerization subunit type 1 TsaB [Gemmatimonadaceae bacterium]|nr:tRNA (adenosine(37)-N6)-threonylcarbamoyltransferase complex dimerization subunit type 1 TsaB [Gemmatimonadaceae bacterium]
MTAGLTLAIESSTYLASCALFVGAEPHPDAELEVPTRGATGERLLPAIAELLRNAGISPRELTRVICGAGPGSFTSLRVGASLAKGFSWSAGIPLVSMPSLPLLAVSDPVPQAEGRYLAIVDAMRDERFAQGLEIGADGSLTMITAPMRVPVAEVERLANRLQARTIGPGAGVSIVQRPHARGAMRLPDQLLREVDVAGWEPEYGRLAEAQVKWEAAHGRSLGAT